MTWLRVVFWGVKQPSEGMLEVSGYRIRRGSLTPVRGVSFSGI